MAVDPIRSVLRQLARATAAACRSIPQVGQVTGEPATAPGLILCSFEVGGKKYRARLTQGQCDKLQANSGSAAKTQRTLTKMIALLDAVAFTALDRFAAALQGDKSSSKQATPAGSPPRGACHWVDINGTAQCDYPYTLTQCEAIPGNFDAGHDCSGIKP